MSSPVKPASEAVEAYRALLRDQGLRCGSGLLAAISQAVEAGISKPQESKP